MDGGVSLLLTGKGDGQFEPVWPNQSGILVPGDARGIKVIDLDGDRRLDLVFVVPGGPWPVLLNRQAQDLFANP
jgi:hypothetical protein